MDTSKDILIQRLRVIQDTALETHEAFERKGNCPLLHFERKLVGPYHRLENDVRLTMLWQLLLMTRARIASQLAFQEAFLRALPSADYSFIVRQLSCRPPRVWSFRRSYQRAFAHTVAGPERHKEISIDACLMSDGAEVTQDHLFAMAWTLSFEDKNYLICAASLTREQFYAVENIRPYPLHVDDDEYWDECFLNIIADCYPTTTALKLEQVALDAPTDFVPEKRFRRLQKLIQSTIHSTLRVQNRLHEVVATQGADQILLAVDSLVAEMPSSDQAFYKRRVLEALGCDEEGFLTQAHPSLLMAASRALLLLDPEPTLDAAVHPRDAIKLALEFEITQAKAYGVREAFENYQNERRWLSSFECFDFSCEEHAIVVGVPIDSIRAIFSPKIFESRLAIAPQGDLLKQVQDKFALFLPDADPPTFGEALEALLSRKVQRSNAMAPLVQWLFTCLDRWRYLLSEIEPDASLKRSIDGDNQKLLKNGLSGLAAMFAKSK